jgi:hypothetical protein
MSLGSTQPLTELSTSNFPGGKGQTSRKTGNLTAVCLENVRPSKSQIPTGLQGILEGQLFFVNVVQW